ncbi:septation protein SepH [Luteimicrobium subarcticum]|uniref:DUF3071 domain-containing protein n=1 Tax=Luteimicrobium subarcticum TaxID=620910 RepID=A0A2M8W465_9MICO|nr:septation protein SepH [Luteimicrobium subarcticum]PJI85710.1 Protein of unknown function (DUF3071) [Luteimicrobium subarcticum]
MNELNLVGLHEDGECLVLECAGQRYTLHIDDALRAAVRRDRPQLERERAQDTGAMSVREIQARIRAGATAEEVASVSGLQLERVRRYEGPVLAEREHVVSRARASLVGPDGSPSLDELVADRLAARGVDPLDVAWDSARDASGDWHVTAVFAAGGVDRTATWRYDAGARDVTARDDEARWLSESEVETRDVLPRSAASARETEVVRAVLSPVDERDASPDAVTTDALLDDLGRRRGRRADEERPRQEGTRHPSRTRPAMTVDLPHLDSEPTGAAECAEEERAGDGTGGTGGTDDAGRDRPDQRGAERSGTPDGTGHRGAQVVALPLRRVADAQDDDEPEVAPAEEDRTVVAAGREHDVDDRDGSTGAPGSAGSTGPDAAGGHDAASGHVTHDRQRRGRRSRTKIPSWDEIMFGARPEQ